MPFSGSALTVSLVFETFPETTQAFLRWKSPGSCSPNSIFGLVDNDCVPVTLIETHDLISLAESQHQWADIVGHSRQNSKLRMILLTEAHLKYDAGPVISTGSTSRASPIEAPSTAETLASELLNCRVSCWPLRGRLFFARSRRYVCRGCTSH